MKCLKCNDHITDKNVYGLHVSCFIDWFSSRDGVEFQDLDLKSSLTQSKIYAMTKKKDTFFHGRYLKYSARLGLVSYILKVQEQQFPELPIVEYVCNQMADVLGIDIPEYHLIYFNNCITFVTRNFMQDYVGSLHHLYKYLPPGEEHHNCEEIRKIILLETQKLSDVAKFIEICLFDSLIGNNDRHGRNLGIIETSQGKKLAPMYDNPSFLGIESESFLGAHFNPSGSIWTRDSKEPKTKDYIKEFIRLGDEKIVHQFSHKIKNKENELLKVISDSIMSEKRKNALIQFLKKRIEEFRYGI